jgi:hypothetical protein
MRGLQPIEFDADALRVSGPLLKEEVVRPGDVLLVRGKGTKSQLIALASGGRYSHAALWMPIGHDDLGGIKLAEADKYGVGFTLLFFVSLYDANHRQLGNVYRIPGSPDACVLLRHPEIFGVETARINEASRQIQHDAFFKTYSAYPRLLEAANLPKSIDGLAKTLAHVVERTRFDEGTRGSFCSELVGMFYSKLDLALFSDGRNPDTISPNSFLLPECRLGEVQDAFLDPDHLQPGITGYGSRHQERKQDKSLQAMIRHRRQSDRITKSFDEVETFTREMSVTAKQLVDDMVSKSERQFERQIMDAERFGDKERVDRLRGHAASYKYGHCLLQMTLERDGARRYGDKEHANIEHWNSASFTLQRTAHKLMADSSQALVRDSCLFCLRVIRKVRNGKKLGMLESIISNRNRVKTINAWKEQKKSSRQAQDLVEEILRTDTLTEEAHAYVVEVVQSTYQALLSEFEWEENEVPNDLLSDSPSTRTQTASDSS